MRMSGYSFKPSLVPTVATMLLIALTVSLGRWQLHRAQDKIAQLEIYHQRAALEALQLNGTEKPDPALLFRRVAATGVYDAEHQIFVDNQVLLQRTGFHVLTPLQIEPGGAWVLVNRGWIARSADYPTLPQARVPPGRIHIEGLLVAPIQRFLELSSDTIRGRLWQNLRLERYRAWSGRAVMPLLLLQQSAATDGLERDWEPPDTGIARHQGYAFQWFALALAVLAIYVGVNAKRLPATPA
jgi:surfeit locus 1 family protein